MTYRWCAARVRRPFFPGFHAMRLEPRLRRAVLVSSHAVYVVVFLSLGGDYDMSESGPAYTWNRHEDVFTPIATDATLNCHDVQSSYTHPNSAFWVPSYDGQSFEQHNASSGALLRSVPVFGSVDINHVQLIEQEATAIISSRLNSAVYKIDVATGAVAWQLGGYGGTFDVYDLDGTYYPAGASPYPFGGQHNAEWFGDGYVYMFDNRYGFGTDSSRMIILSLDEDAFVAHVVWEYVTDLYTPYYGDADRLPTGNVLGTWWAAYFNVSEHDGVQFEARVAEVTRGGVTDGATAWRATVQGPLCSGATCMNENRGTWKIYSAEVRFTDPIHPLRCDGVREDTHSRRRSRSCPVDE